MSLLKYIIREELPMETKYIVYTNKPFEAFTDAEAYMCKMSYTKEVQEFATLEEAKKYAKSRVFLHKMYIAEIKPVCSYSTEIMENAL